MKTEVSAPPRKARNSTEQWHRDNDLKWMNEDQWECFEMLADICGGAHHIGGKVRDSGIYGINLNMTYGFHASTFDYNGLTTAVLMAHDRCIRFEIRPSGPRMLGLYLHKRRQREGDISLRHPTIETAIASYHRVWCPSALAANTRMDTFASLLTQRDGLLAALRSIADSYPTTEEGETMASIARDAIESFK